MESNLPPDDAALPPPTLDEELVAYLDGELDAEAGRRLEQRLADDATARSALRGLQVSWDALDELDQADVGQDFTRTTLEMVAVRATKDVEESQRLALCAAAAGGCWPVRECWRPLWPGSSPWPVCGSTPTGSCSAICRYWRIWTPTIRWATSNSSAC